MKEARAVTVGALMDKLRGLPAGAPVLLEGCDCWGECGAALLQRERTGFEYVLLARTDGSYRDRMREAEANSAGESGK